VSIELDEIDHRPTTSGDWLSHKGLMKLDSILPPCGQERKHTSIISGLRKCIRTLGILHLRHLADALIHSDFKHHTFFNHTDPPLELELTTVALQAPPTEQVIFSEAPSMSNIKYHYCAINNSIR
jgi:hypothetical protein